MVPGVPVLGSLLAWRRDHLGVFLRAYQQFGPVFAIRIGPVKAVVLIGPRHHEWFFREADRTLSVPEVYRFVVPMFGDVMVAATDTERRRRHVRLLQGAFQGGRLERYTEVMVAESDEWLGGLGDSGTLDLWDTIEPLVMRIAARALLGPEVRARVDEFRPLLSDLAKGMDFVLPPNLPLPKFYRRDRARRRLTQMLRPLLDERRLVPGGRPDFLQTLVDDPDLAAEGEQVQVGMALCTLFTGYITTAAQACWTLVHLLQNPGYLALVLAELDGAAGGAGDSSPYFDRAFKESVRLQPVMSHYARTTSVEYEVDGFRIPRGWLTILCPGVAHRLPEIFADPDRYDPDRFGPERAEDRRSPHALIGFSGGFYRCPGQAFGTSEIRVLLGGLLSRYELTLLDPDPQATFDMGVTRPRSPCRVGYRRRPT